jgi:hypothetical protein
VALSTAILALLAAIASLLAGEYANEAMMDQIEAADQWSYYQAKASRPPCSMQRYRLLARRTNWTNQSATVTRMSRKR